MNKIFYKICAISIVAVFSTSCSDFLDKEVSGNSTDKDFYDTKYKLQSGLDAVYDILQSDKMNSSDVLFGDATADDVKGNDEGLSSQRGQLVNFRFNTSNDNIKTRWEIYYEGVHRANEVIANAHRVQLSTDDYTQYRAVREILGQAKFLRAYFYFNLVRTFGGVPIRPETEEVNKLVVPRSSKEEVYAYIEKDLREAAIMLPARYNNADAGKASEGAAVALLMKVLMYEATPGIQSDKWEEMKRLGEFFVDGKSMTFGEMLKYDSSKEDWESLRKRLWFKPKELFNNTDTEETPETLLNLLNNNYSVEYKDYLGKEITYVEQFFQTGEFCQGSIFEIVFKESADGTSGDTNDGGYIFDELYSTNPYIYANAQIVQEIFGNSDPRRQFSITHQQNTPDGDLCQCGPGRYVSLKWYTPRKERPQYGGDNGKNRRILRFADVLLMYAEALNECGNGAAALENLNRNKAQANKITGSTVLYIAGGYGYMRDQIYTERRRELCFEFERFFDLVRQGRAASVIKSFGNGYQNKRGAFFREGVNEIFPIPQTEIDISNGVVTQNPGY